MQGAGYAPETEIAGTKKTKPAMVNKSNPFKTKGVARPTVQAVNTIPSGKSARKSGASQR